MGLLKIHKLTQVLCVMKKASVLKEVQIMRTMNHPSVVKFLFFKETQEVKS
jgi:hypothetical protein